MNINFESKIMQTAPMACKVGVGEKAVMLHSAGELESYLAGQQRNWQFRSPDINSLQKAYENAFFADHVLIAGVFASNSGSTKIKLRQVTLRNRNLDLLFSIAHPGIGLHNMMSWHYFVAVASEQLPADVVVRTNLPLGKPRRGFEIVTE